MQPKISDSLRDLLETKIDSFEKLDVVIALRALHPRAVSLDELVARSGVTNELASKAVAELATHALVAVDRQGDARLAMSPASKVLQELADLHERDRPALALVLAEIGVARVRRLAVQAFIHRDK